jgi:hypothetical protein
MTGTTSITGSLKEAKTSSALTGAAGVGGIGEGGTVGVGGIGEGGTVGVSVGPGTTVGTVVEIAVGVGSLVGETGLQAPSSSETTNDAINRKLIRQSVFFIAIRLLKHLYSIHTRTQTTLRACSPGS